MRRFDYSEHSYNDADLLEVVEEPTTTGSEGWLEGAVEALAPGLFSELFGGDARVEAATLEAEISKIESKLSSGAIFGSYWENQLAEKKAQLAVIQQQATESQIKEYVEIGMYVAGGLALVTVIGLGLQGMVLLKEKTRSEQANR